MPAVRWEKETAVPPKQARAWFFDLREDDHTGPHHAKIAMDRKPGDGRKILSRGADFVVTEDTWNGGRQSMRFTVRLAGDDAITIDGEGKGVTSHARMTFAPRGAGTLVRMDSAIEPKGLVTTLMMPLFFGKFRNMVLQDMDAHVAEMEDEWKSAPW